MNKPLPRVLIACKENWDTLMEIPFVIKQAGCIVDVYCSKHSWLLAGSYYDNWIESKATDLEYANELAGFVDNYDWIVLGDEMLLNLMNDQISDPVIAARILPLKKNENRYIIASKLGLSKFCQENDILSPRFMFYTNVEELEKELPVFTFPVLIKPNVGWGGGGIILCDSVEGLKHSLSVIDYKHNLIIQEFINGRDIGIEAFYKNGELLMYNASVVLKYFDSPFSFTTRRTCFKQKEIEIILRDIGRKIGIHGFASVQMIEREERFYLLEVDMRPNFWVVYDRFAGSNFSDAVRMMLDSEVSSNTTMPAPVEKHEIAIFYRDIIRCFNQKDIRGLLQWQFGLNGYGKFIPRYDKKLYKRIMRELFVVKMKKRLGFGPGK